MREFGRLILAILFGVVMIWLLIKLLGAALKVVAVLIGIGVAVAVYFAAKRMLGPGR